MIFISNAENKPKRSVLELISMLKKDKGVTFDLFDEVAAASYLLKTNNYMRTAAYRKNYDKYPVGCDNKGKYIGLDFAYLAELSTIDMHLRSQLLKMCISVEHALKVQLLEQFEILPEADGYSVVTTFLLENNYVLDKIALKADTIFIDTLIDKYFKLAYGEESPGKFKLFIESIDCPIWVLVELIDFGELLKLYDYCAKHGLITTLDKSVFNPVKSLRNVCAHNNCILHNIRPRSTDTQPPQVISN